MLLFNGVHVRIHTTLSTAYAYPNFSPLWIEQKTCSDRRLVVDSDERNTFPMLRK